MMRNLAAKKVPYIAVALLVISLYPMTWCFVVSPKIILRIGRPLFWSYTVEVEAADEASKFSYFLSNLSSDSGGGPLEKETIFSLQSPRKWLEYCETNDGREGAYSVMRCDFFPSSNRWRVWGADFHKQRLLSSFQSLTSDGLDEGGGSTELWMESFDRAMEGTYGAISTLLKKVEESCCLLVLKNSPSDAFFTVMVTVLWVPYNNANIRIRAHGFHSEQLEVAAEYNPAPMTASLACGSDLPTRYQRLPQSKLSSWCRRRTPLETRFKTGVVGEVLLTRECKDENDDDDVELLEGLTSNLFVVYHNGTLRTPPCDSVLGGYARQLILDCAASSGTRWEVMEGSIKLSEASQWKEVFTTSGIRLVSPVNVVIQVQPGDGTTKTVWTQSERNDDESSWKQVYLKILDTVTIGRYGDEERKSPRLEDA